MATINKITITVCPDSKDKCFYLADLKIGGCMLGIQCLSIFPVSFEDMKGRKTESDGGNSFTSWKYNSEKDEFVVNNSVSGEGGDSTIIFLLKNYV